ncbi:MAG: hypothetical protein LC798_04390 [Chloroflexi bacterium]|nr:hypothetical protein [Chloroflexota bacterium]
MATSVRPIADADRPDVADFLHRNFNDRVPVASWARAMSVPWPVDKPNSGFMLVRDGDIVGAYLAFYSTRVIDGRLERFCNLGAWCVLPEQRLHSLRLLKALLAQEDYHFTDLSPSGSVPAVNERLGFQSIDTATWLALNLPWPSLRRGRVTADAAGIEHVLHGAELELYRDHAAAGAARHVLLRDGDEHCYVIFRKDRRKGLGLFATLLYVGNPQLLTRMARPLARHLLLRHGAVATLAERRIIGTRPPAARELSSPRPRMFRSPRLREAQIDYLYSELVCLAW